MIVQPKQNNINNNYSFNPQRFMLQPGKKKKKKKCISSNISNNSNSFDTLNLRSRDIDSENQKIFTRIAVLNIRIITDIKLQSVLNYMKENKINILGLTETQKTDREIKLLNVDTYDYKIITHNDNKGKGKGLLLIVTASLEKHIYKINKYRGHVLTVDFCFKKNKKLRIILVYNVTGGNYNMEERIDINNKIIGFIKDAKRRHLEIVCLGDFNMQYRKYQDKSRKYVQLNKALKFFGKLEELNLWDVHKEFLDMDVNGEIYTYTNDINNHQSRIDYIWVSENIFVQLIDAKIKTFSGHKLDHKLLTFNFENSGFITRTPSIKSYKNKKIIFDYGETKEENIDQFNNDLIHAANSWNEDWSNEKKWQYYKDALIDCKNTSIIKKEINISSFNGKCEDVSQHSLYKNLKFIIFLRRQIKKRSGHTKLRKNWRCYRHFLRKIVKRYDEESMGKLYILNERCLKKFLIGQYMIELNLIYDNLYLKLNLEYARIKNERIKEAVERRCEDLTTNQRRMIDSITEKEIRKIYIDRLIIEDENKEEILVTDENHIKQLTINHFRDFASSQNREVTIDDAWIDEYNPIDAIDESIYKDILSPIMNEEWIELIDQLPIGKATGPTNISYEDIKKAPDEYNKLLINLINNIFVNQDIPGDWKKVNIYPIPKPKPWGYRLENTRPITLLEISRKIMMKIITNRLSKVIKDHAILKGFQYAGLPLKSTFKPLRIINEIIQHANERDKELWILALDMSKAYDRINIVMLKKVLKRIKIPDNLITLLTDIFLERKNRVFTPGGLTDEYDMQCGIDQGEIISPLLWIIYYDPLLTKIRNSNLGYNIDGKRVLNLYEDVKYDVNFNFPGLSYMDDTNFIAENLENLEKILDIAESFYNLNDIKINKTKSELLLRVKRGVEISQVVNLKFGNNNINIVPATKFAAIRILGVWFNAYNRKQHIIAQIKEEVKNCCDSFIARKRLTDKQMSYIFNVLIIPKIEYRAQLVVLTKKEADELIIPFRVYINTN